MADPLGRKHRQNRCFFYLSEFLLVVSTVVCGRAAYVRSEVGCCMLRGYEAAKKEGDYSPSSSFLFCAASAFALRRASSLAILAAFAFSALAAFSAFSFWFIVYSSAIL